MAAGPFFNPAEGFAHGPPWFFLDDLDQNSVAGSRSREKDHLPVREGPHADPSSTDTMNRNLQGRWHLAAVSYWRPEKGRPALFQAEKPGDPTPEAELIRRRFRSFS